MKSNIQYLEEIYQKRREVEERKLKNNFYNTKFTISKFMPLKMVATFILTIGVTIGIG